MRCVVVIDQHETSSPEITLVEDVPCNHREQLQRPNDRTFENVERSRDTRLPFSRQVQRNDDGEFIECEGRQSGKETKKKTATAATTKRSTIWATSLALWLMPLTQQTTSQTAFADGIRSVQLLNCCAGAVRIHRAHTHIVWFTVFRLNFRYLILQLVFDARYGLAC